MRGWNIGRMKIDVRCFGVIFGRERRGYRNTIGHLSSSSQIDVFLPKNVFTQRKSADWGDIWFTKSNKLCFSRSRGLSQKKKHFIYSMWYLRIGQFSPEEIDVCNISIKSNFFLNSDSPSSFRPVCRLRSLGKDSEKFHRHLNVKLIDIKGSSWTACNILRPHTHWI